MIFFDVTKTGPARHRSGLTRVSRRLREELGSAATALSWDARRATFPPPPGRTFQASDWLLTAELFSEDERPGFTDFLRSWPGRRAGIFHDAIPLRHPHFTWPQSVARHPGYLTLLADFDRVWAVSRASRDELTGFWRWQGRERPPPVSVLPLGADFDDTPRRRDQRPAAPPQLLCLGILEPRKHQDLLLTVGEALWTEGLEFTLHLVGRVNPHFGEPLAARVRALRRRWGARIQHHPAAADADVARLFARARATVFPTLAEGCGLPLLESLWMGVPCVCSDLPVLRENADAGGCLPVPAGDARAWQDALRRLLVDDTLHQRLQAEARSRPLPTWAETAAVLTAALA